MQSLACGRLCSGSSLPAQIMEQTARFVRDVGGQTEFLLGVQQAANPAFSFLKPHHRLHPYFRWLVQEGAQVWPPELRTLLAPAALAWLVQQ